MGIQGETLFHPASRASTFSDRCENLIVAPVTMSRAVFIANAFAHSTSERFSTAPESNQRGSFVCRLVFRFLNLFFLSTMAPAHLASGPRALSKRARPI
jgi:hypothetical protein